MSDMRVEVGRLAAWEERHRRLTARLALLLLATLVVDAVRTSAMYILERHARGTALHSLR